MDNSKYIIWVYVGAVVVIGFIIYKVLSSIGLIKTSKEREYAESKNTAQLDVMKLDYFSPSYYRGKKVSITQAGINSLADKFYDAVKGWGTNEDELAGVFAALKYKTDVSFLAEAYLKRHGEDLRNRIISELDKTELVNLLYQLNDLK